MLNKTNMYKLLLISNKLTSQRPAIVEKGVGRKDERCDSPRRKREVARAENGVFF